jgi:hypothetical protein
MRLLGDFVVCSSYLSPRATVSMVDLSRSVAIVFGRWNVARFVSIRFDATLRAHIDIGYDEIGTLSMAKGVGSDACV